MQSRIALVPRLSGIGGMVSFQLKFAKELSRRGIAVSYDLGDSTIESILVIGGTRRLSQLWRAKRHGMRIVQRLDGMNWIHRVRRTGARHWLRAEYGNFILSTIRDHLADRIVYQSRFSQQWWELEKGLTNCQNQVVYNGVDLEVFCPDKNLHLDEDVLRILMVEGSLLGGYDFGLENAVQLVSQLAAGVNGNRQVELWVVGKVFDSTKQRLDSWLDGQGVKNLSNIRWLGAVANEDLPEIYQQAHLLFSGDINAACPNSVIESIACGTPVLAFDTGALREILGENAGLVVPYGGNPWKIDAPDISSLVEAAVILLEDNITYRNSARERAEAEFGLSKMVDRYMEVLFG